MTYAEAFSKFRRAFILEQLAEARGNQLAAAERMGIHRNTLGHMIKEEGITAATIRGIRDETPVVTEQASTLPYPTRRIYRMNGEPNHV